MRAPIRRLDRQAGLSLIELLVAVTVLALAMGVALLIYDDARASYKVGDNLAEQQQVVRVASDRLTGTLRMAGYNTNPDGNRSRPDEQIELAAATAIVVRADFDAADPVASRQPEETLDDGAFPAVSTGNDEIVGYFLAKDDGSSTGTLTLWADVAEASRDGDVERVDIDGVDLLQDDPPYTLYKVWLDNDPSSYGGGSFVRRAPMADNVRALRFRYFDAAGNEIAPPGGDEAALAREDRAAIRRIAIEVEAQTRDPLETAGRVDRNDPDPDSRRFLKFALEGDVSPRNLGRTGIPNLQADTTPPTTPATPQLFPGHCGGLYASWSPNPGADEVSYYKLVYGGDPALLVEQRSVAGTGGYIDGLADGSTYYVALTAIDAAGNQSPRSPTASATTANVVPSNTPVAPTGPTATTTLNGRVDLAWEPVDENLGSLVGDPQAPMLRDLAGYRVYRADGPGGATTLVGDETASPASPAPSFVDTTAVNCRPHYYEIRGVDRCGATGEASAEVFGRAQSTIAPRTPDSVHAYVDPFLGGQRIDWQDVELDVNDDAIHIDSYIVSRAYVPNGEQPADNDGRYVPLPTQVGESEYHDPSAVPDGYSPWYRVKAIDACTPANESAYSEAATPTCAFVGHVEIDSPRNLQRVNVRTWIRFHVEDPGGLYVPVRLRFHHLDSGTDVRPDHTFPGEPAGTSFEYQWEVGGAPTGLYRLYVDVAEADDTTCIGSAAVTVDVR